MHRLGAQVTRACALRFTDSSDASESGGGFVMAKRLTKLRGQAESSRRNGVVVFDFFSGIGGLRSELVWNGSTISFAGATRGAGSASDAHGQGDQGMLTSAKWAKLTWAERWTRLKDSPCSSLAAAHPARGCRAYPVGEDTCRMSAPSSSTDRLEEIQELCREKGAKLFWAWLRTLCWMRKTGTRRASPRPQHIQNHRTTTPLRISDAAASTSCCDCKLNSLAAAQSWNLLKESWCFFKVPGLTTKSCKRPKFALSSFFFCHLLIFPPASWMREALSAGFSIVSIQPISRYRWAHSRESKDGGAG